MDPSDILVKPVDPLSENWYRFVNCNWVDTRWQ